MEQTNPLWLLRREETHSLYHLLSSGTHLESRAQYPFEYFNPSQHPSWESPLLYSVNAYERGVPIFCTWFFSFSNGNSTWRTDNWSCSCSTCLLCLFRCCFLCFCRCFLCSYTCLLLLTLKKRIETLFPLLPLKRYAALEENLGSYRAMTVVKRNMLLEELLHDGGW